jgi:hypothetical protein
MKSLSNVSRTKKIALAVISLAFLCGITLFISEKTHKTNLVRLPNGNTPPQTSGPTKEQRAAQAKADAESKQQYLDKTSAQSQAQAAPSTVTAPSINLTPSQSGSSVTVLTKIQGVSGGSCTLFITNGNKTNEQTAQVIYQPEFSSCAGFTVPVSSLGAGMWNITVKVLPVTGEEVRQSTSLEVRT